MKQNSLFVSALSALLLGTGAAAAAGVIVTSDNLNGWQLTAGATETIGFVTGPDVAPCGTGSLELTVGVAGSSAAQARNTDYAGVAIADLAELSYSTYVQFNNSEQAVYVILQVDLDGNLATTLDRDFFFFEPVYQDAAFFPSNPQGNVILDQWQTWDAANGGWWSLFGTGGATPGTGVKTLADALAAYPNAVIHNSSSGAGGLRFVAGFGGPADWSNFVGNLDCVTVKVGANEAIVYDFEPESDNEPDSDNDGVPDSIDQCVVSDLRERVDVNGTDLGDTTINNTVDASGCSLQDHVNDCAAIATTHGAYVSCIVALANDLFGAGVITKAQRQEMIIGASKSTIGK